jgi:ribosomal protein L37AE/L43A
VFRPRIRRRAKDPYGTMDGHPAVPLYNDQGDTMSMLTVCAECQQVRTILFLSSDRWYCSQCRAEGDAKPKLYPIA